MATNSEWIVSSARRTLKSGFIELFRSRPILYALVKRELKSRYRGSLFGFAWALGKPLSLLLVYSLVIGEILGANRSLDFFALYLFVGLMFWGFFSEALSSSTNSLIQSSGLLQKVAFPREIIPLTSVVVAGVNTLIQIPVLILGYIYFDKWPNSNSLNLLPILLISLFFFTLALSLLLSALNVYVRDVQPLTELSLMLLMYASPIIYSWTFVYEGISERFGKSTFFEIYMLNPMSKILVGLQDVLWPGVRSLSDGTEVDHLYTIYSPAIWYLILFTFGFALISYQIFLKLEPDFAREL